nr:MAG: hypothetical protein [Sanya bunya-like virus 8]
MLKVDTLRKMRLTRPKLSDRLTRKRTSPGYSCTQKKDVKGYAEEVAQTDFSSITIFNPVEYVCYPWFGPGDFYKLNVGDVEYYVSSFPGNSSIPRPEVTKIKQISSKSLVDIESVADPEKVSYLPRSLKSKEEATAVLKDMGIFNSSVISHLFPESFDIGKMLSHYLKSYEDVLKLTTPVLPRRTSKKVYLPGFQGILEDSVVVAEMKAIFGENCYYIFNGNVKLSKNSYKHYMRMLKRLLREANANEKSLIIFLISIILDTTEENDSDGWFLDKLNMLIEGIEERVYGDDDDIEVFAPAPNPRALEYVEEDIF